MAHRNPKDSDGITTVRTRNAQLLVLAMAYLAVANFAPGHFLAVRMILASDSPGACLWFSLPYVGFTALFVASIFLAHRRHLGWSTFLLMAGLLISLGMCAYDFTNARWQFVIEGHGRTYIYWWWYYEPSWYGYEPVNLLGNCASLKPTWSAA